MAVDKTAAQSDWITLFRQNISAMISTLGALDYLRLLTGTKVGTPDTFVPGAFTGTNGSTNADLAPADLDAALTSLTTLRSQFYDPTTGLPTPLFAALLRVAPTGLPS